MDTLIKRPELSDSLARYTLAERRDASVWLDIITRVVSAVDKSGEIAKVIQEYPGLKGLSKSSIYRKISQVKEYGVEGLMSASARRRGSEADIGLPFGFIQHWQSMCGQNQRRKARAAYRRLIQDWLQAGRVIPGYEMDWRGIWASEHPGAAVPVICPYSVGGQIPKGWSYRNLVNHKPDADVWAGASTGVSAMHRSGLPSIPHTRVDLEFASAFVVDDVWHDLKINFSDQRQAERPLELGMMEVKTGRYVSWGITPVRRNADGSREMIKESYMRYLIADLLCRHGVSCHGVTIIAEHGTAAVRGDLLKGINKDIQAMTGITDFVRISLSSVTGEPIAKGMFTERACGNPRHKAMLESSWNLLHNETAHLIGQVGKDRDHAPQELAGRDRENAVMIRIAGALCREDPEAAQALISGDTIGYLNYFDFTRALLKVKGMIEQRTDHNLEGWDKCGYTRQVVTIQGADIDLTALDPEQRTKLAPVIEILEAPVRCVPLSPLAAWQKEKARSNLIVFPASLAARILGEECGQRATVAADGTITIRNDFSRERISCSAIVQDSRGCDVAIARGTEVIACLSPFDATRAFISDSDGRYIGTAKAFVPATYLDKEADKKNLALWQKAAADQRKRLEPVMAQQQAERRKQIQNSTNILLASAPGGAGENIINRAASEYVEEPIEF